MLGVGLSLTSQRRRGGAAWSPASLLWDDSTPLRWDDTTFLLWD